MDLFIISGLLVFLVLAGFAYVVHSERSHRVWIKEILENYREDTNKLHDRLMARSYQDLKSTDALVEVTQAELDRMEALNQEFPSLEDAGL